MNDAEIVKKYLSLVYYIAGTNAKQQSDADDIAQEVFLRFVSKKPKFHDETHARAWFIRVTFNVIKSFYKSAYLVRKVDFEPEAYENVPSDDDFMGEIESNLAFQGRLDRLPADCRTVMLLRFGYGYAIREIADLTGYKINRVKTLLLRGKREYKGIVRQEDRETQAAPQSAGRKETVS